ncbi:MAG: hypothetical protein PUC62_08005, partial [Oscillospiraceae bacterium]|nr:hypothetical protein [Oscillospiraceae bacterium]
YAAGMRRLCRRADVILPNLTEACLLAGKPYCESYTERDISNLLQALRELGPNCFRWDRSSPPGLCSGTLQHAYSYRFVMQYCPSFFALAPQLRRG